MLVVEEGKEEEEEEEADDIATGAAPASPAKPWVVTDAMQERIPHASRSARGSRQAGRRSSRQGQAAEGDRRMGTLVDAPTGGEEGGAADAAAVELPTVGAAGSWAQPASRQGGHTDGEERGGLSPDRAVVPFREASDVEGDMSVAELEREEATEEAPHQEGISLPVTPRSYPC